MRARNVSNPGVLVSRWTRSLPGSVSRLQDEVSLIQRPFPVAAVVNAVAVQQARRQTLVGPDVMAGPEPAAHALVQRQRRLLLQEVAARDQPQLENGGQAVRPSHVVARLGQLDDRESARLACPPRHRAAARAAPTARAASPVS